MRLLSLIILLLIGPLAAAEPEIEDPLWDGHESIADYAKKVHLPAAKTLTLGNGIKLELVLIPAGKFIMGTPPPTPVDEADFNTKIGTAQACLAASGGALLVLLGVVVVQAIRKRRRPQLSLGLLLLVTFATGGSVLSGLHWRRSAEGLQAARFEFSAAEARFKSANDYEKPAHAVTLAHPFYMGKYAVTQEQYQQLIGTNPSQFKGKDNPVERVTWEDAQAFCTKLTELLSQLVRLPTEAEWEYSCRAGTTTAYHSGDADADLGRVAWYAGNSQNTTHPVGQKEANAFGLYDMHGNVWQWCRNWYNERASRSLRGGSWRDPPMRCRSAIHINSEPGFGFNDYSFRIVVAPKFRTP